MNRPILRQAARSESSVLSWRAVSPLLLVLNVLVSACDNEPGRSVAPELTATSNAQSVDEVTNFRDVIGRVSLDVAVLDAPVLGRPIRVRINVHALVPAPSVKLTLILPELEVAKVSGWRMRQPPPGFLYPHVTDQLLSLDIGQQSTIDVEILIPVAGYYRLSAQAYANAGSPVYGGKVVQDIVQKEVWLIVNENGGVVSPEFDPRLVPDSVVPAPGPRQMIRPLAPALRNGDALSQSLYDYVGTFSYWNANTGTIDPLVGGQVSGSYRLHSDSSQVVQTLSTSTDAFGNFTIPCLPNTLFKGYARLTNASVSVSSSAAAADSVVVVAWDPCIGGHSWHVIPSADAGRAWATLAAAIPNSQAHFNRARPWIRIRLTADDSHYHPTGDSITLYQAAIIGPYGRFATTHEYGHAFHSLALGVPVPSQCPANHYPTGAYNLRCAYMEGVANFFTAIVLQDSLELLWEDMFESPHQTLADSFQIPQGYLCVQATKYKCAADHPLTVDGALGEAHVAAFLYDLADNASTRNATPYSDDDGVSFGAAWVGDIIAACEISYGTWVQHDAVDHLVYCFEHRLGNYSAQGYFPTRNPATQGWRLVPSVSDPTGWNADAIRTVWQANMYIHGPPQPPPPSATIDGLSMVRPNVQCLWTAGAGGGIPPYVFEWTVDGTPVGSGSASLYYVNAGASFTIYLTVTDAIGGIGSTSRGVTVTSEAQECLDQ